MRCDEGEYDAPVTPERRVFRQKVVGRTKNRIVSKRTVYHDILSKTYEVEEADEQVHRLGC